MHTVEDLLSGRPVSWRSSAWGRVHAVTKVPFLNARLERLVCGDEPGRRSDMSRPRADIRQVKSDARNPTLCPEAVAPRE